MIPQAVTAERLGGAEAGFFMIEALIAIGLIAVCAGAVFGAVVAVQHQSAVAQPSQALTLSAQNVLTDLRAATAYDGAQLKALAGKSAAFDALEPAPNGSPEPLHVSVRVGAGTDGATVATVTVRNTRGQAATVQSALVQEAPAPGSVVPASTPVPVLGGTDESTAFPSQSAAVPCDREPAACQRALAPMSL